MGEREGKWKREGRWERENGVREKGGRERENGVKEKGSGREGMERRGEDLGPTYAASTLEKELVISDALFSNSGAGVETRYSHRSCA